MKLNEMKCNFIHMNMMKSKTVVPAVKVSDGTKLEPIDKVTYLGGVITKAAYPQEASPLLQLYVRTKL